MRVGIVWSCCICVGGMLLLTGCGTPAEIKPIPEPTVIDVPDGSSAKPVQFRKIVAKLNRGQNIGAIEGGLLCVPQGDLTWRGGRATVSDEEFTDTFREELRKANYPIVGDPNALFDDPSTWRAEILVAGLITTIKANICFPYAGFGNYGTASGEVFLTVDWQIYSRLDRQVIYKVSTSGSAKTKSSGTGGIDAFYNAFAQATRGLLADQQFHAIIAGNKANGQTMPASITTFEAMTINGVASSHANVGSDFARVQDTVVTIFAGDGFGSGFLISRDGYILTNSHVVETAKSVRIKMNAGSEIIGQVIRSDRRHDIALIKIDGANLKALPLASRDASIGSDVYAVGSPFTPELHGTVTKGVVSGYRVEEDIRQLQSDAAINPGNSGGPLIDSSGNVVGIARSTLRISGGGTTGVNFFVPIKDGLEALNLKVSGR